ncbi:MAG: hypothetical protein E7E26_00215 [Clostridiales bacterium]|nr:hypothetical protein [Clostridiales bacterium]
MEDKLYAFVMRGELTKVALEKTEVLSKHSSSDLLAQEIFSTLERSRNVIMHSGELGKRDIERIGTNIRDWISQVGV